MNVKIRIDIKIMRDRIETCCRSIETQRRVLDGLQKTFQILTSVAWLSPAATAMIVKINKLMLSVRKMIAALEGTLRKLQTTVEAMERAETNLTGNIVGSLQVTAFRN